MRHLAVTHRELGLGEEQVETIIYAAAMHDIGKIAIPDSVLLKPGKLTEYEYAIMKRTRSMGVSFCRVLSMSRTTRWLPAVMKSAVPITNVGMGVAIQMALWETRSLWRRR